MTGWLMAPQVRRYHDGGHLHLGPLQFQWGWGNGATPRGFRVHLTWPVVRSLYFGGGR